MTKAVAMYTVNDVAELLGVSSKTVRRMIHAGKLPAFSPSGLRTTRIRSTDLETFVEANRAFQQRVRAVEAPCVCRHKFSEHRRASSLTLFDTGGFTGAGLGLAMEAAAQRAGIVRHTHACMRCACNAWEGLYQRCLQCHALLTESEGCSVATILKLYRSRWLPTVVSICAHRPWRSVEKVDGAWIETRMPPSSPLHLRPKDAQMMAEAIAEVEESDHGQ
jgi:excisionase family DNA binding protein